MIETENDVNRTPGRRPAAWGGPGPAVVRPQVGRCNRARLWTLIRFLSVVLLPVVLGVACGEDRPAPDPVPSGERVPRQVLEGTEMRQTSVRGLLWILRADRAISYEAKDPTELEELQIDFYDGADLVQSVLTSRFGSIDSEKSILIAEEDVVVETEAGDRLETAYLEWDPETERVHAPGAFTLYRREDVITGVGIDADPGLTDYAVHSELRAVMRGGPDGEIDGDMP